MDVEVLNLALKIETAKRFGLNNGLNQLGSSLMVLININLFFKVKHDSKLSTMKGIKLSHWVERRD